MILNSITLTKKFCLAIYTAACDLLLCHTCTPTKNVPVKVIMQINYVDNDIMYICSSITDVTNNVQKY